MKYSTQNKLGGDIKFSGWQTARDGPRGASKFRAPPISDGYSTSTDGDFIFDITSQMRYFYYNPTCSSLWDTYAVTNNVFTSAAVRYVAKHYYLICFIAFIGHVQLH